jgi:hypothetical protein
VAGSWGRLARWTALVPLDGVKGQERALEARQANASAADADLAALVAEVRAEGLALRQIAHILNTEGHTTRRGCRYNAAQVMRVLTLADA